MRKLGLRVSRSIVIAVGLLLTVGVEAQNLVILVGDNGAFYNPNITAATVGTTVTFRFVGTAHSVVQSSYDTPCAPMNGGFDSGLAGIQFPGSSLQNPMEWNLTITNDTIPIWYHCKATHPMPHCQAGMVGGINVGPPETLNAQNQSFDNFLAAAKAAPLSPAPTVDTFSLSGFGATATALPQTRGDTPASIATSSSGTVDHSSSQSQTSAASSTSSLSSFSSSSTVVSTPAAIAHKASGGPIAGGVVGGVAAAAIILGLFCLLIRSRRRSRRLVAERMAQDGSSWLSTAGQTSMTSSRAPWNK